MRVVVIGAGILGAAIAAGLTRRGARVTVLEERFPGAGTTGTSFARISADADAPEAYFTLNHAAVHAHHALGDEAFFPTGHLEWATDHARRGELAARVERLRAAEYAVEPITAVQAAELEACLAQRPVGTDYVLYPEEAYVFPAQLLGRFLNEAREGGAAIETGTAVREINAAGTGVTVILDGGGRRTADVVVSCAGRWTGLLVDVPLLDPRVAGTRTNGFLATTSPVPARLSRALTTDRLNVRPDGGGRLLLQAPDLDDAADPDTRPGDDIRTELLSRLPEVLTGTEGACLERARVGQRAMPADGLTVAGFLDPAERVYAVVTHSGITLAPLLSDLVTGELYGNESALLSPFRPGRFTTPRPDVTRRRGAPPVAALPDSAGVTGTPWSPPGPRSPRPERQTTTPRDHLR